jgi:seryl-tRNA synthetase
VIDESTPALAVDSQWLKTWNKFQQSFFLASELSLLIHNRVIAVQLGHKGFERLSRLLLLPFLAEVPAMTPEIENDIKTIKKVLSRKTRKWIEDNGEKCAQRLAQTNFKDWAQGIRISSYRSGLLFCNKLEEAIHAYKSILKDEVAKKPWDSVSIREMILYTITDECGALRKALGTSIYSV